MRSSLLLTIALLLIGAGDDPITWTATSSPQKPLTKGAKFNVNLQATIQSGWHLYAMDQPEGGPIATEITLPDGQPFAFAGTITAPKPLKVFDANFKMPVEFYLEKVRFRVPMELDQTTSTTLQLRIRYQCCNDKMCLPPKTVTIPVPLPK